MYIVPVLITLSLSPLSTSEHYNSLHKLMDEYIHYVIELLQSHAIEAQYNDALRISTSESQTQSLTFVARNMEAIILRLELGLRLSLP